MITVAAKLLASRRFRQLLPWAALAGFLCALMFVALIGGAVLVLQQQEQSQCGTNTPTSASSISAVGAAQIPPQLIPIYQQAASAYQLGSDGWAWLAAINRVETDFGRDLSVSSAGAIGWMQFEPATWAAYGVDADHDGVKDPYKPIDAINGAANYLHASGAPANWQTAVFAYNHSAAYYQQVAGLEQSFTAPGGSPPAAAAAAADATLVPVADTTLTASITLHGRASTYGNDPLTGWIDGLDNNQPALPGATNDTPGIAVYNMQTLGGWWEIHTPNGRTAILQQTDYGPLPPRIVDINAVAARTVFGYPTNAFPTDQGTWTLQYLGKQRPANATTAAQGATASTAVAGAAPTAACMPCPATAPAAGATLALAPQVDPAGVPDEHGGVGFTPGPGTDYTVGEEPQIATRLDTLGRALSIRLTGISGYRSPQHSVAVGGFSDDPHTRGEASDTDGAQGIPEATLEQYGLTRPFPGAHEANHIQLLGSAAAGVAVPVAATASSPGACQAGGTVPLAPGDRARILPNGLAEAPADAPPAVQAMIAAGNQLIGLPYLYGGGHGTFNLAEDRAGIDCSGAVSWVLHAGGLLPSSPEDSTTLQGFQTPGSGLWVTVYANTGHTFIYIAGIRMDTSPWSGDGAFSGDGPRWRPATRSTAGFVARHPASL
jgi:hypothetical protein